MNFKMMKIDELIPYENNPRDNEEAVGYVANSIKEFGFKVPIVVDKHNVIVAGHTRLLASKELGLEEIPVVVADDLSYEQIKAFRLADNKTGEVANWDMDKLFDEIQELGLSDIDMDDFGFDEIDNDIDLSEIYEEVEPKQQENVTPKLTRGSHSIDISETDIEILDKKFHEYEALGDGRGFVRWLTDESNVSSS